MDVVIHKAENPSQQSAQVKKKRKVSGVSCTVYKPFEEQIASLNLPSTLSPLFEELDPKPGFLRIWPDKNEDIPLVETKYGLVPRGSVLSYQQQQPNKRNSDNLAHPVPNFDLPDLEYQPTVLAEKELLHFNSLKVSLDQALEYEQMTRDQSMCQDWHRLRKFRLTASNFKAICSRRKDMESLSARLLRAKVVQTAAMRYGIQHEDEAANQYADQFGREVYPVGFVINPSLPHLGCSPDRRVYDPSENDPWGLLEIKCTPSDCLSDLNYLKHNSRTGTYSLKKTHAYYYQTMGFLQAVQIEDGKVVFIGKRWNADIDKRHNEVFRIQKHDEVKANTFGKIDKDNFAALKRMTEEIISSKQSASKVGVHNLCNLSGEKSQPLETLCGQQQTKDTAAPIFWKYEVKQEKFVQQCNLIGHAVD
ncbi:PREDICTED: uncharacterized protein LOC107357681 [Acropora digitifera]|uniref:uncharacterized protein LOC107357681 n=1 Tax=Acropora digitifera TaxID=70779 RepID=UPI00077A4B74|nr:PREDICTED: uncharacterized protein LOC107357681 [Acropora digitifera]